MHNGYLSIALHLDGFAMRYFNFGELYDKRLRRHSGSFAPSARFEKGEIHKVFLPFPNLRLSQNLSLPALAVCPKVPLVWR